MLSLLPLSVTTWVAAVAAGAWCALAVDERWGEPPLRWHPVAWMGRWLAWAGPRLWCRPAVPARLLGALAWTLGAAVVGLVAWAVQALLLSLLQALSPSGAPSLVPSPLQMGPALAAWTAGATLGAVLGWGLKPLLAWRMLREEVLAVDAALAESLEAGRRQLSRLVSRDVSTLDAAAVREAAIETLAENLNDSVVAPLLAWAVAGLPGAAVYRFANTADAMWGYRDHRRWMGAWAARADDVLSWLPARLTAAALWWVDPGLLAPGNWGMLRAQAALTPSPNGGWPMAAMALRLDCRLGKPGVYLLNPAGRAPGAGDVQAAVVRAERVVQGLRRTALVALVLSGLAAVAGAQFQGG